MVDRTVLLILAVAATVRASDDLYDCRYNNVHNTEMETKLMLEVLSSPQVPEILVEYVDFLMKEGAFVPPAENVAADPHVETVFKFARDLYLNIRAKLYPSGVYTPHNNWARWLYTYIQADWQTFLDFSCELCAKTWDVECNFPPGSPSYAHKSELDQIMPRVTDAVQNAVAKSKAKSFNEIRSYFAEAAKRTRQCYPPNGVPMSCTTRETALQNDHWLFNELRGRANRLDTNEDDKVILSRGHSIANAHASIMQVEKLPAQARCFFKLTIRHEGKAKFKRANPADGAGAGLLFDLVDAPFIAGPSGTIKQIALTIEAGGPSSLTWRERILAGGAMVVLAGGHHSTLELILGMQIMGYMLDVPSILKKTGLGKFADDPSSYDPLMGGFIGSMSVSKVQADIDHVQQIACSRIRFDGIISGFASKLRRIGVLPMSEKFLTLLRKKVARRRSAKPRHAWI